MILFPDDIQAMNELLARRSSLDPELLEACQGHIEHGQYADAVLKAFIVLEGRIQHRSGIKTKKGAGDLIGRALASTLEDVPEKRGPLTKKLGLEHEEAVNLMTLLRGAFAVFRNPEGHAGIEPIVEYGSAECQAVLAFVNLMLSVLDRQALSPLDQALKQIRRDIGPEATERLARFLERARTLGLHMPKPGASFSFRAWSWRSSGAEVPPKRMLSTVFFLRPDVGSPNLHFTTAWYWPYIVGFDYEVYVERLKALGCAPRPGENDLRLELQTLNSAAVFDRLYAIVRDVVQAMEATVTAQQGKGQ
jgi:hypothetical protein